MACIYIHGVVNLPDYHSLMYIMTLIDMDYNIDFHLFSEQISLVLQMSLSMRGYINCLKHSQMLFEITNFKPGRFKIQVHVSQVNVETITCITNVFAISTSSQFHQCQNSLNNTGFRNIQVYYKK